MKVLKLWHKRTFEFLGEEIELELKAMSAAEAPSFLTRIERVGEAARGAGNSTVKVFESLPEDFVKESFAAFVRLPEPFEIDGAEVKTGADLAKHVGYPLAMAVLIQLEHLATVGPKAGKGSGRPSTSGSEPAASAGASAATPIEPEAGQPPSTATPTPHAPESSGAPE